MKLKIGISPCPNDTYIFEAIFKKLVSLEEIEFEFVFHDVQKLNELALENKLDIIKVSYAHYFSIMQDYQVLNSGGAMGFGVGPLLISQKKYLPNDNLSDLKIAIPGKQTTAHFLLNFFQPHFKNKIEYSFENIEQAILNQEVDAGVIIHENRFTYLEKGLNKIIDLGEYWESQTQLPIPLGCIAIKNTLDFELKKSINYLIKKSIDIAHKNKSESSDFIRCHAQEMRDDVMKSHIQLYVNDFSKDIGPIGKAAVSKLYEAITHLTLTDSIYVI
ncbi:MAG TPA: 1,4-dihydroxy-6-naphthoate synthase [Chitinophagaceae bacterium]|nr:1,4-dihydroxy-6-naphthoate synthase [Chitinophagaceae bacterium]